MGFKLWAGLHMGLTCDFEPRSLDVVANSTLFTKIFYFLNLFLILIY